MSKRDGSGYPAEGLCRGYCGGVIEPFVKLRINSQPDPLRACPTSLFAFYYQYRYDAENKLVEAFSGTEKQPSFPDASPHHADKS